MTSKKIVQKTLDFENPERIARSFCDSDFIWAGNSVKTHATEWEKVNEIKWERKDEWGNIWSRIEDTSKGEVEHGVLENIDDIKNYKFPDYSDEKEFAIARNKVDENPDRFILGWVPGFTFNIARKLRKLDQYMMDLILEPAMMSKLHDKIDMMIEDMITNYGKAGVDAIMFCEDWGTQQQTLISPEMWRKIFFPRTKKLCRLAHNAGMKVIMHSCGKIGAIIPGLMEAGIDALQFDQPTLHGIDTLAEYQEHGKITFWCPVDIQKTLQTQDEALIRTEAREMIEKLWRGRGGFIAGYYADNRSIGLEPKWQEIACDEFIKRGSKIIVN